FAMLPPPPSPTPFPYTTLFRSRGRGRDPVVRRLAAPARHGADRIRWDDRRCDPESGRPWCDRLVRPRPGLLGRGYRAHAAPAARSEEHTSELQSQSNLVCRLLL